jgi:hypothetical protein
MNHTPCFFPLLMDNVSRKPGITMANDTTCKESSRLWVRVLKEGI